MKNQIEKMINRRVSKGNRLDESQKLFAELVAAHQGDNLISALVYNSFATEKQAEKFVNSL